MCSFELEFLVKFSLSLLFRIKWSLENLWSSFISVRLHFCDTPKPGDPVDHRQPTETCVSHIMISIHE